MADMPTLRKGDSRDSVLTLQSKLRQLGFLKAFPGGIFTNTFESETELAVKEFQRFAGIAVDGIVGPQTWAALLGEPFKPTIELKGEPSLPGWKWIVGLAILFGIWSRFKSK